MPEQTPPPASSFSEADPPKLGRYTDSRGRIISPNVDRQNEALPVGRTLPSAAQLLEIQRTQGNAALRRVLNLYRIDAPWAEYRALSEGYLRRITRLPPAFDQAGNATGDPAAQRQAFEDNLRQILDPSTKKGLRQLLKQTAQRYSTVEAMGGNTEQLFMRITDGEVRNGRWSVCAGCEERAGAIGTLAMHEAIGAPGFASCQGGGDCNCQLVPYDV